MSDVLCPEQWAQQQFGCAELGDKRRTQRAVQLAAALAADPCNSIPRACGQWKDTKAAYRFFHAVDVNLQNLCQPHWQHVRQQMAGCSTVLVLHDTTTLSFNHPATVGLGPTGTRKDRGLGMLLHNSLAVDVSGAVPQILGLAYQHLWARPQDKPDDAPPESVKWTNALAAIGRQEQPQSVVHVGDAESDCWEMLQRAHEQRYVLRSSQNRLAVAGHGTADSAQADPLYGLLRDVAAWGSRTLYVRGQGNRDPRWAKLRVSAMPVTLFAPKNWPDKPHRQGIPRPDPIRCGAVRVWEVDAPGHIKPIEWILLTNEPVEDLASALRVASWYSCRWLVEEFHKALKTGCRVEDRQLENASRLEPLVGMLSLLAVRLLSLKYQAKMLPDRPAEQVVPPKYVRTLAAHRKLPERMSCHQFWREVAKLGGFLGRRHDGDPGWITLWRGWSDLELITEGYELARRSRKIVGNA